MTDETPTPTEPVEPQDSPPVESQDSPPVESQDDGPTDRRDPNAQAAFHRRRANEAKAALDAAATAHASELETLRTEHAARVTELEQERDNRGTALEAERDAALEQVRALSKAALTSQVAGYYKFTSPDGRIGYNVALRTPSDLFDIGGHEASEFLDETGQLDQDRVLGAIKQLYSSRSYLFQNAGGGIRQELSRGAVPRSSGGASGWGDKLHPTDR